MNAVEAQPYQSERRNSPRLVYIIGRGHSGSTILDSLISVARNAFGTGELVAGMRRYQRLCSCGEVMVRCPRWSAFRRRYEAAAGKEWDAAGRSMERQASVAQFLRTWFSAPDAEWVETLRCVTLQLVQVITDETSAKVVIDSSKEVSRGLFATRFIPDTRLIHLVRHPESMLASTLKRIRGGIGFRFMRRTYTRKWLEPVFMLLGALGWLVGNVLAELVMSRGDGACAVRVRYEDLCADPVVVLREIGDTIGLDLAESIEAVRTGRSLPLGHRLAGNDLLGGEVFSFDPSRASTENLPIAYRALTRLIAWPLMLRYGYLGAHSAP